MDGKDWAAECDLRIVNIGSVPTCVRPQGFSVIDLTWSTPDLIHEITNWYVAEDTETLSDHKYIRFQIGNDSCQPRSCSKKPLRWNQIRH